MNLKLTKSDKDALLTLIEHARRDIGYGTGGTYLHPDDDGSLEMLDKKAVKQSERAIELIKEMIILG